MYFLLSSHRSAVSRRKKEFGKSVPLSDASLQGVFISDGKLGIAKKYGYGNGDIEDGVLFGVLGFGAEFSRGVILLCRRV